MNDPSSIPAYDRIITGAQVVDVRTRTTTRQDVGIKNGRIAAVTDAIDPDSAASLDDAHGCYLAPGLIDLHTHVFEPVTWSGVDCDQIGPETGVTCWVDAGSAGALTFKGFEQLITRRKKARVLAFLNISSIGLVGPDFELANLSYCDVELCAEVAKRYRDAIVGIKVRMGTPTVGPDGLEPLRRALDAAERVELPVMVHVAFAPPTICEVIELLRPGDILTHCYTGVSMRIVDDDRSIYEAVIRAFQRGVLRDVGHGAGSFSFETAEIALAAGLPPDVISTDLHTMSLREPREVEVTDNSPLIDLKPGGQRKFDLPKCLNKFLAIGMPLLDVLHAATAAPAELLGVADEIGYVEPGHAADLFLFKIENGHHDYHDMYGNHRVGSERIVPVATLRAGEPWHADQPVQGDISEP